MIPHRVKLSGFLSYKEEQEILFGESPLWMLAGLNGSGKSTIFDALTYALFGHHRGGSQSAQELINKDSKSLAVEFDFWIDKVLYRAKRTYRKNPKGGGSGTQQIFRWERDTQSDSGEERWVAVLDANKKVEFDNWIKDKIGLNYETFTSSVLLLQGRAEKLLDSKPSGRAEVLAGIVDLERYQRLHEKADTRRKSLKAEVEGLENQRSGIPEVSDFEWAAAEADIAREEENRQSATLAADRLQQREFEARKWMELQARLQQFQAKWKQAEALIAESGNIEKDFRRLHELREVLPHINTIQQLESEIEGSQHRTRTLTAQQEKVLVSKTKTDHALDTAKKKRGNLQTQLSADEAKQREVETKLRLLSGVLVKVKLYEDQRSRRIELQNQLDRLPADPKSAVSTAQQLLEQRIELGNVVPQLERFARQRNELAAAKKRAEESRAEERVVRARGEQLNRQIAERKAQLESAAKVRQEADARAAETRTLLQQAKAAAKDFQTLEGKKICRHCGQNLTPKHYLEERGRREQELVTAEKAAQEAIALQTKAVGEEQAIRNVLGAEEEELAKRREEFRERKAEAVQAGKDADRNALDCKENYLSMPEAYRSRIRADVPTDWATTTYPTETDLVVLRRDAGDLDALRRRVREAQDVSSRWEKLQAQVTTTAQTCDQLQAELPKSDPVALRSEQTSLQADEAALGNNLNALRKNLRDNETEIDRQTKAAADIQQQLAALATQLSAEDVKRKHELASIERAKKTLPEQWRILCERAGMGEQHQWKVEQDELIAKGTEFRHQQLSSARIGFESLQQEIRNTETEANGFPPTSRCSPDEVQAQLREAQLQVKHCDRTLQTARQQQGILEQNRKMRKEIDDKLLQRDREHNYFALLSQLLGRDRLQRHLVREAERQIVDYANGVLDRLSGGQLFLQLCGGEEGVGTERALELEAYNRTTGDSPINVAFLSGSQRFRVAVSLALGIGQYASRQHRPIESVIIDEGFGCLDRQGRQVMIQELQNLRGHLQCILLVSHQDEFADAFPDGYRFELRDGATRISRFRR